MYDSLRWRIPLILALTVAAALVVFWGQTPWASKEYGLKLGFDLKGGVELSYRIEGTLTPELMDKMTKEQIDAYKKGVVSQTKMIIEIVSKRIDPTGVKAPDIRSESSGEIILRLPGLTPDEVQSIKRRAEQMGVLEFREVVSREEYDKLSADEKKNVELKRMTVRRRAEGEKETFIDYYVRMHDPYNVTGRNLKRVYPTFDQYGAPAVGFTFDTEGARAFAAMTRKLAEKGSIAIILNGRLHSAPRVNEAITQGSGIIEGGFKESEVQDLVSVLQAGSLPAQLVLQSEMFVGPDLGTDSRDRGYQACVLAFLIVVAFMAIYYLVSGAIADLALAFNLLFLLAAMIMFGAVLTLPGIAGIVLTVGMAVDANVLIYERVREELQRGQTLRIALRNGYQRAFVTIFDSNITTLITAIILYWFGTGAVRGFAVTLSIGIVISMFTSLFISRAFFDVLLALGWLKERLVMMKLMSKTHVRFVRLAPACIITSLVCIVVGMTVFFWRGRDNYGIDFSSGTSLHLRLKGFSAKCGEVAPGSNNSAFTVRFSERRGDGTEVPVDVSEAIVREGLVRLRKFDASLDAAGVAIEWPEAPSRKVARLVVPESPGATDKGRALAQLIEDHGQQVFRLRKDIQDIRRMVAEAGFRNADVQTAFQDQTIMGRLDSDQFTIRVPGRSDNETQEQREAVPTDIERVFRDLVDRKSVDVTVSVDAGTSADNATTATARVTLGFVQFSPADNTTVPVGLRRSHIETGLQALDLDPASVLWPKEPRKYYEKVTFDVPKSRQEAVKTQLLAHGAFTFPDAFSAYYFVNPGQAHGIIRSAIWASLLSFVGICAYVWVRFHGFKYGIAAVAALVHDVLFTLGLLAIFAWWSEKPSGAWIGDVRLSLDVVAGILTLIGYSINDTIVVFDRIRENLHRRIREMRGKRQAGDVLTPDLIDRAINETLSRTTLTSFTTWIVVVTLFVVGGARLHGLALCLIIGVVVGTYSSIAIASPILVLTHAWERRRARASGGMTTEEREVAEEEGRTSEKS